MATKLKVLGEENYVVIGRRHGSDEVAAEARETRERWARDLPVLTSYGYGEQTMGKFDELQKEHTDARTTRSEAVAAKSTAVQERNDTVEDGFIYVNQILCALSLPAMDNEELANDLNAARPADTSGLKPGILALARVLDTHKALADPAFDAAAMVAKAEALAAAVDDKLTGAEGAKAEPMSDTRAIDLLDGKLVTFIARVNKAGRKAFRSLDDDVKVAEYRYHHLTRRSRKPVEKPPVT